MTYPQKMNPRTRRVPVACAAMVGLVLALAPAASASSDYPQVGDQAASEELIEESTSFRSCKKMRTYYPRGVAKSTAAGNRARADGFGPTEVNKKVYKANKKLDTNGNRVACEVSAAKARKQFRAELLRNKCRPRRLGSTPRARVTSGVSAASTVFLRR